MLLLYDESIWARRKAYEQIGSTEHSTRRTLVAARGNCGGAVGPDYITAQKRQLEQRLLKLNQQQGPGGADNERPAKPTNQRRQYPQVFPKYRNPFVPTETWSGRGKRPRWLVAALKAGGNIEDFAVSGDGKSERSSA